MTLSKLVWLIANCNNVHLECNQHRAYYQSAAQSIDENQFKDAAPEVLAECVARDTIITLQVYPSTPIGFHFWVHYDVEKLIADAYAELGPKETDGAT